MAIELDKKKLALGVGTMAIAGGIGAVMQFFEEGPSLSSKATPTPPPALEVEDITLTSATTAGALPARPETIATEAMRAPAAPAVMTPDAMPEVTPAAARVTEPAAEDTPAQTQAFDPDCAIVMEGAVGAGAMVTLDVAAPCLPNERFVLHHSGMMFSALTDETGAARLVVPALAENAVFISSFANGEGDVVQANVPELAQFGRAVVQWRGDAGLGLHAREYEADYFTAGHIRASAAGSMTSLERGASGYLQTFGAGADPLMAEVYTYPLDRVRTDGTVALSVEAEVTAENCGAEVEAQTLQVRADAPLRIQDVMLFMPDCEATGDFLVLKNLLQDMTLAARQ